MFNDMTIETQSFVHPVATLWREDKDQTCCKSRKQQMKKFGTVTAGTFVRFIKKNWISELLDKITEAKRT